MAKSVILKVSISAFMLSMIKLIFGAFSGSITVLASALDSLLDVCFSLFNFLAIKKAESPSNHAFNYGFGKVESLASLFEGIFIAFSGIFIIFQSFSRFIAQTPLNSVDYGIGVMIFSIIWTIALVIYLQRSLSSRHSLILQAEILHYKTDLLSNAVILLSLLIVKFSGFYALDAILGALLGAYIIYNAFKIAKNGFLILLDRAIDEDLCERICAIISANPRISSFHSLKSRISGDVIFLECHLVFDEFISLADSHTIADEVEREIWGLSSDYKWEILFHLDPYDDSAEKITRDSAK